MAGDCDSKTWDAFNHLMTCSDVERIRKVLARHEFFKMSLEIPGDIVECGVFKGSGLLLWVKLLRIYCPASAKRVIGFDTFGATPELSGDDAEKMTGLYQESGLAQCVTADQIERMVEDVTGRKDSCLLVPGDICKSARVYTEQFPGARISLLHMDQKELGLSSTVWKWPMVWYGVGMQTRL